MKEVWKDIPNYEGLYQVSNLGNIKSLSFGAKNHKLSNIVTLLKKTPSNMGYYKVELYKNGKSKMYYVHRLVAMTFIPNPENKPQVNHIDGDKSNNSVSNLEWATSKENLHHAVNTGLRSATPMLGRRGSQNPTSKIFYQYDLNGNYIATHCGISETARQLGIKPSVISACLSGRNKTGKGYIWKSSKE